MKMISVGVSNAVYEEFRQAAATQHRSIALLIREAMAFFLKHKLRERSPLTELPVLPGHRIVGSLPTREELYGEIYEEKARR